MKTFITILMVCLCATAVLSQEHERTKGKGTDKTTPANKDYDKPVSKGAGKMQIRKSGDNLNDLADTTRQLDEPEQNTTDRFEDFSASTSGSASSPASNDGLLPDGTNTAQRASYNMAGSPVGRKPVIAKHAEAPKVIEKKESRNDSKASKKKKKPR